MNNRLAEIKTCVYLTHNERWLIAAVEKLQAVIGNAIEFCDEVQTSIKFSAATSHTLQDVRDILSGAP